VPLWWPHKLADQVPSKIGPVTDGNSKMGFFFELLGFGASPGPKVTAAPQPVVPRRKRNVSVEGGWLTMSDPFFFGQAYLSPSKRWVVSCNDSDGSGRGGHRESGNGRVLLLDRPADLVVHELTSYARPMDAAVSDTGSYVINDHGFGSALHGELAAIGKDGRERYRRVYQANVYNIGLSSCGRYAVVQTCHAQNADGNLLEVLDIERSCAVFSVQPASGWADAYSFDVDSDGNLHRLGVEHNKLGKFSYSSKGEFMDATVFEATRLTRGDYTSKIFAARDLLKSAPTPDNAHRVLTAANAALEEGAKDRPDWGSLAHRLRGEAFDVLGQMQEALGAYEEALAMNPKVGVQKRAASLRKAIKPAAF
jgi:hypothetical protein